MVDGAFEGAWAHYPPLKTRPEGTSRAWTPLFISHLHPDHCDPATLSAFRREIPILVLDHGPNFLHRVLKGMGFTRLIALKDAETGALGPFAETLYAPFAGHLFHGRPTVEQLACNAAGPYPSCFDNLSEETKRLRSDQILERNFEHAAAMARILDPEWQMPFAGA